MPRKQINHVVYFVGAGASTAIASGKIPAMNLFPEMSRRFEGDWDKFRRILKEAEFEDGPGRSPEGAQITFLSWPGPKELTNIEELLQAIEEKAASSKKSVAQAAEEAYELLKEFINRLFVKLDAEIVSKTVSTPYDLLAKAIHGHHRAGLQHSFVSFNYDIWLEQALQRHKVWDPNGGYFVNTANPLRLLFSGPNRRLQEFEGTSMAQVKVYKPHGALSLMVPVNDPFEDPVLLFDGDIPHNAALSHLPAGKSSDIFRTADGRKIELAPLIMPPTHNKGISGKFLHRTYKGISRALEGCDAVVIIGWSMPITDFSMRMRIMQGFDRRSEVNLPEILLTCDVNETTLFYNRFRSLIPSERTKKFSSGFSGDFIEELKHVWEGDF